MGRPRDICWVCSAGLSGGLELFSIWSLGTSREWRFLTPSGSRLLWSRRSGAFSRGKNLQTRVRAPKLYLTLMFIFYALAIFLVVRANG